MKKAWRTLAGVIAAIAMAVAGLLGVGTAYADDGTYTISIDSSAETNHTYEVYQIFTGDYANGVLSNVKWGKNGTGTEGEAVDADTITALTKVNTGTDAEKLAVIKTYANLNSSNKYGKVSKAQPLNNVPAGYYLIKDTDNSLAGQDDAYTLYVVKVVGNVAITPKSDKPTSQKKVKDANDSTGVTTGWQDSADYDIGDKVPFQLTATIGADYANYKVYKLTFHDTEGTGLTFDSSSVKVYVDNDGAQSETPIDTSNYQVVTEGLQNGCTFEIRFADLKTITGATVQAGSVIRVEYTSTLNQSANIGSQGNPNTMHIEFSNNPNDEQGGETGKTPDDTVIVFTYKTVINKKDQDQKPLAGAAFQLDKFVADENGSETHNNKKGSWQTVGTTTAGETITFTFTGLDDGDYRLTETTTPAGYNTIDPIEFTITATHTENSDDPTLTSLSGNAATGEITFTADTTNGSLTADVVNQKGSSLPETGGMGTVALYAGGAAIVLLAVIGLAVTARRRNGTR